MNEEELKEQLKEEIQKELKQKKKIFQQRVHQHKKVQ